jgi:hypothetical protein
MIRITREGFQLLKWNAGLKRNAEAGFDFPDCLNERVTEVEEGVTLEDIITFTARDRMLRRMVGACSRCDVLEIYNELRKGVKPLMAGQKLHYCTVVLEVEITEKTGPKPNREIEANLRFYGCDGGKESWPLDLEPPAGIAALPFRLEADSTVAFLREDRPRVETGMRHDPELLGMLNAIFRDLSFGGTPEEKAEMLLALKEAMLSINGLVSRDQGQGSEIRG